jgi:hypothetical protein
MHFYFLANTSHDKGYRANIKVWAQGFIEQWDLATGEVRQLESTTVDIPPRGSFAFTVLTSSPAFPMPDKPAAAAPKRETVAGPFKFKRLQPNVLLLDRCRYTIGSEAEQGPAPVSKARAAAHQAAGLGPHVGMQPWALEWKGIKVDRPVPVALRFEVESEIDRPAAFLVVERAGDYKVTVNGQPAPGPAGWHWDRQFGKVDVGGRLKRGSNEIRLETTFKPGVEIEDAFLVGDFGVKQAAETRYVLVREPAELRPGSWVEQGYPFFVGNMSYQVPVTFKKGEQVRLRLDGSVGTLFVVRAQGKEIARLGWQPWEADVTAALKPGRNVLELVVVSSLENAFGPLHNDTYRTKGNDWWFGPNSFADAEHWTDAYHHEPYGLGALQIVRSSGGALAKK